MSRENDLLKVACRKNPEYADVPSFGYSGCENHNGEEYVVLRNNTKILSVWLVGYGDELSLVDYENLPESLQKEYTESAR